ncbi:diadenosine tetraphosphatase [Oceanimonas sp. GK1]|jgi:bis(5'-nucleosyl)-tetraphosphatase (symmetrical)|uniref:symmetrical bis(5'-nucleosyl)-tetraphosphatase n=1 Tax=Oceanimonas sp. (strain GK1 / IBRC-M 10197) TaxID=511062 RepID=UPI00024950A5|nr:symmetrical bis(5'-nucleosyl)-tetraphosphatase [Oceanimonas sp. GK1]AEY00850.1 diadenosine tetraphosphatase [Oceanimonas sp. GK1]
MATYIVGDLQGCLSELNRLLAEVGFSPSRDQLWLTGDLVARGPDSLGCLRRVMALGDAATTVLGNHDLHLLAVASGLRPPKQADRIHDILQAADRANLLYWLRHQPLLAEHPEHGFVMTHAGIPPQWTVAQARDAARAAEDELRSGHYRERLRDMYGNQPDGWREQLDELERLRFTINAFTRMRLCHADGRLDFDYKEGLKSAPVDLHPWFDLRGAHQDPPLVFGHWAALEGHCSQPGIHALDTGCVWGGSLTLLCWETGERISTPCPVHA